MSGISSGEKGSDADLMKTLTYEEFLELMVTGSVLKRYSFVTGGDEKGLFGEVVDPHKAFFEELSDPVIEVGLIEKID